jgi:hypothetical protein
VNRVVEPFELEPDVGWRDEEPQEWHIEGQGERDDLLHGEYPSTV